MSVSARPKQKLPFSINKAGKIRPLEDAVHRQLANYVKARFPYVIFTSESAGIRLTMHQARNAKILRSGSKLPDFWMAEPRGQFCGLFLEIKRDRQEIYTTEGQLRAIAHIQEQNQILYRLRDKGYKAEFGCGFDESIDIINEYMRLPFLPARHQI
jgi:hypothetical protein